MQQSADKHANARAKLIEGWGAVLSADAGEVFNFYISPETLM